MKIFLGANTAEICQAKVVFERAAAAWPSLLSPLSLSPYLFLHFSSLLSLSLSLSLSFPMCHIVIFPSHFPHSLPRYFGLKGEARQAGLKSKATTPGLGERASLSETTDAHVP